jgi:hypothetical protein
LAKKSTKQLSELLDHEKSLAKTNTNFRLTKRSLICGYDMGYHKEHQHYTDESLILYNSLISGIGKPHALVVI